MASSSANSAHTRQRASRSISNMVVVLVSLITLPHTIVGRRGRCLKGTVREGRAEERRGHRWNVYTVVTVAILTVRPRVRPSQPRYARAARYPPRYHPWLLSQPQTPLWGCHFSGRRGCCRRRTERLRSPVCGARPARRRSRVSVGASAFAHPAGSQEVGHELAAGHGRPQHLAPAHLAQLLEAAVIRGLDQGGVSVEPAA